MAIHTPEDVFEYYRYTPSIAAAVIFIILFSITTALHLYQLARIPTWSFLRSPWVACVGTPYH
jgi:hypothetical protein